MSELPTRLLRETVRAGLTPDSSSGCLDTETLAAWSDGTLSRRDRAAAESHAASCGRCQALLAAMVRSTPEVPSRSWWRPSVFGWLAPLAAAAVALVVWINIPATPRQQPAAVETTAAPPASTPPSIARELQQAPSAPSAAAPTADARRDASKKPVEAKLPAAPPAAAAPHREKADERPTTAATESSRSAFREAEPKVPPGGLRDSAVPAPAVVPPLPVAQPAPPPAAPADSASTVNTTVSAAPAPPASGARARSASGFSAQALAKAAAPPPILIASPDPRVLWRVLPASAAAGGTVARSIDGGLTWQPQATGFAATLTAGSAPSPTTCWLAGAGGIVLLTTDGRTWQRVPFPETIDLTSIRAADAANAEVTAADGRTFTTNDGGRTWRPKE